MVENGLKVAECEKQVRHMFIGEYNHSIDAKGRLIVPSKFREALGTTFFVTKGLDGCLSVYPTEEWTVFESKLRSLPITNKNARMFTRFFLAGATECEIDKQGRILIPAPLREYAGLFKDAVLVGVSGRIEIWSKDKWEDVSDIDVDDMSDIAEHMEELGISL